MVLNLLILLWVFMILAILSERVTYEYCTKTNCLNINVIFQIRCNVQTLRWGPSYCIKHDIFLHVYILFPAWSALGCSRCSNFRTSHPRWIYVHANTLHLNICWRRFQESELSEDFHTANLFYINSLGIQLQSSKHIDKNIPLCRLGHWHSGKKHLL